MFTAGLEQVADEQHGHHHHAAGDVGGEGKRGEQDVAGELAAADADFLLFKHQLGLDGLGQRVADAVAGRGVVHRAGGGDAFAVVVGGGLGLEFELG